MRPGRLLVLAAGLALVLVVPALGVEPLGLRGPVPLDGGGADRQ